MLKKLMNLCQKILQADSNSKGLFMKKIEIEIPIYRAKKIDSDDNIKSQSYIKKLIGGNYHHYLVKYYSHDYEDVEIDPSTLAIHFHDMTDSKGNKIFASLREDGRGGDIFEHSVNCRLDSPRPHDGTYWISCKSPLVYKDFGFYFKYHIIDSTPKYADGKITNRKGLARFEKNLKVIGIQD